VGRRQDGVARRRLAKPQGLERLQVEGALAWSHRHGRPGQLSARRRAMQYSCHRWDTAGTMVGWPSHSG